MILKHPFQISARLMPALNIDGAWISLGYAGVSQEGRQRYRYFIDLPGGFSYTASDLESGVGGGTLQEGFETLLVFLLSADGGFPPEVIEWAEDHAGDLGVLEMEIEETPCLINERE